MTDTNAVPDNVVPTPAGTFPRMRHNISNGELENIQTDLRKTLGDLGEVQRRLQTYCDNLKTALDSLTRGVG